MGAVGPTSSYIHRVVSPLLGEKWDRLMVFSSTRHLSAPIMRDSMGKCRTNKILLANGFSWWMGFWAGCYNFISSAHIILRGEGGCIILRKKVFLLRQREQRCSQYLLLAPRVLRPTKMVGKKEGEGEEEGEEEGEGS